MFVFLYMYLAHPGTNNGFQVNTRSPIATRYNDQSVLENMHCAESFRLMQTHDCSPFANLSRDDHAAVRGSVIKMILATDMSFHFALVAELNTALTEKKEKSINFDSKTPADVSLVLRAIIHSSDIANSCKPRPIYLRWTELLFQEFLSQGDIERSLGLPISMLCDRNTHNLPKSQVGFFNFIVSPLFKGVSGLIPEASTCCELLAGNGVYWDDVIKSAAAEQAEVTESS